MVKKIARGSVDDRFQGSGESESKGTNRGYESAWVFGYPGRGWARDERENNDTGKRVARVKERNHTT